MALSAQSPRLMHKVPYVLQLCGDIGIAAPFETVFYLPYYYLMEAMATLSYINAAPTIS